MVKLLQDPLLVTKNKWFGPTCIMLGRTLTIRGVAATLLQAHTPPSNAGSQHSLLLAWQTLRKAPCTSSTLPQVGTIAHIHSSTSFLINNGVQSETLSHSRRLQCHLQTLQTPFHHLQTYSTSSLPLIATRGLATLSSISPSKSNVHNRSLPDWSPRGVVVAGGVAVGVKGMAKDKGGFNNLHGRISSLQLKKRMQRKKKKIQEESEEEWQVTAYATADEYDLERLLNGLTQQGLYSAASLTSAASPGTSTPPQPSLLHPYSPSSSSSSSPETNLDPQFLPDPSEVLHVRATYRLESEPREIYFFRSGAVVFWNVAELERNSVLRFLRTYQEGGHDKRTVVEESESLTYTYSDTPARTKLVRDTIFLNPEGPMDLEKYTFSNALAISVQLGIWEAALDEYIDNIEYVSEELSKTGLVVLSEHQVLQRMGQLFALRHLVNLSSDLLDVPDFYWEHENLEQLYRKTSEYLSVSKRTSVMNVKLSHCVELMELLKSHLNERHSSRLEWIIIILIMVEVGFELLHFLERLL
ncbi:required for meiotic nuclear division protein 1 homolog isoform X3 [Eriocheir sinensis]|uniref:required for meiotic nuclear division protein 1 homolog isoform X3 n=1 Tax=Eriocheir sinensis TaxID=95602 RepID=UPI0021C769CC|nr:required for meiotic nuclear division protein 1 homolog isoform X3 [Eriocheir sinensis]